jgi:hypothetical protein
VLGYLPGYLREEHYRTGGRFLLAGLLHLPHALAGPASAVAVAAVVVWVVLERPPAPVGACVLIGAVLLATSPIQPWYAVTLLALATVAAMPWWAVVVAAGYPYFFAVILDDRHATAHGQAAYAVAFSVVVAGYCAQRASASTMRVTWSQYTPSMPKPSRLSRTRGCCASHPKA